MSFGSQVTLATFSTFYACRDNVAASMIDSYGALFISKLVIYCYLVNHRNTL